METDEPPKIDNGASGSRATKTGKPRRLVSQETSQSISFLATS